MLQPPRLVSKTGSWTKPASLVAEDVAGDDTAELPVTSFSVFSFSGRVLYTVWVKQVKPRPTKQARLFAEDDAESHPVLLQPPRLVSKTGSGTKPASLVADDVADLDEVTTP